MQDVMFMKGKLSKWANDNFDMITLKVTKMGLFETFVSFMSPNNNHSTCLD